MINIGTEWMLSGFQIVERIIKEAKGMNPEHVMVDRYKKISIYEHEVLTLDPDICRMVVLRDSINETVLGKIMEEKRLADQMDFEEPDRPIILLPNVEQDNEFYERWARDSFKMEIESLLNSMIFTAVRTQIMARGIEPNRYKELALGQIHMRLNEQNRLCATKPRLDIVPAEHLPGHH